MTRENIPSIALALLDSGRYPKKSSRAEIRRYRKNLEIWNRIDIAMQIKDDQKKYMYISKKET